MIASGSSGDASFSTCIVRDGACIDFIIMYFGLTVGVLIA